MNTRNARICPAVKSQRLVDSWKRTTADITRKQSAVLGATKLPKTAPLSAGTRKCHPNKTSVEALARVAARPTVTRLRTVSINVEVARFAGQGCETSIQAAEGSLSPRSLDAGASGILLRNSDLSEAL